MGKLLSCLVFIASLCAAEVITPPSQPESGPGGKDYAHAEVRKLGPFGEGASAFWIYEPASPAPQTAPVIAFLHGYLGVDAQAYGGWIEHLVRRGNVVVYPVYQTTFNGAEKYTANAIAALTEAFRILRSEPDHVRPNEANDFALVGHSLGCPISANIAALAQSSGLPKPKALMACNAGNVNSVMKFLPSILEKPEQIPDLLMLVIVGEDDHFVGDVTGREIFDGSSGIKAAHKNLITLPTERSGTVVLNADHFAPLAVKAAYANGAKLSMGEDQGTKAAAGPIRSRLAEHKGGADRFKMPSFGKADALDFYGYWKWFDALTDAAFHGTHREQALGNTPEQKFMGKWSDGTPLKPATVELAK